MTTTTSAEALIHVGSLEELEREQPRVVSAGGRTIVLLVHEQRVHALANRCPHMGFPLRPQRWLHVRSVRG